MAARPGTGFRHEFTRCCRITLAHRDGLYSRQRRWTVSNGAPSRHTDSALWSFGFIQKGSRSPLRGCVSISRRRSGRLHAFLCWRWGDGRAHSCVRLVCDAAGSCTPVAARTEDCVPHHACIASADLDRLGCGTDVPLQRCVQVDHWRQASAHAGSADLGDVARTVGPDRSGSVEDDERRRRVCRIAT